MKSIRHSKLLNMGNQKAEIIRVASPGVSDESWDKNAIDEQRWYVATQERKVCNMESICYDSGRFLPGVPSSIFLAQ